MLRKISGFLFVATVNRCFFYFSVITKHTKRQRLSQRGQKQGTLNTRILVLLSVKYVFKISGSSVALYSQRHKVI